MDGAYGYELALSDLDRAQGLTSKPLAMAKYKGVIEGKHVFTIEQPVGIEQYSCSGDCQYLTYIRMSPTFYDKQVIKYDPKTIIGAVIADMKAGYLKPSRK